ncbi:MAG: TIGR04076 family protein [Saprospiraceae bacterium]
MSSKKELRKGQFELYDLAIKVESIEGHCTCEMSVGDCFYLKGGKIAMPDGQNFCLYALQSTIPLLPAKQRICHPADWMETDSRVICPDPACKLIMRIDRIDKRVLNHDDVSPNAWETVKKEN